MQLLINTAFEAEPPSGSVQPDAGKQRFLAVSLLYTENTDCEPREPLLTVRRVAQLLGVSTAAVYARCANGTLRHTRIGSVIRVTSVDLDEFVERHSKGLVSRRAQSFPLLPPHADRSATAPARRREDGSVESESTLEADEEQR